MGQPIVHWEIMGPDGEELSGFYSDLFGWSPQGAPGFEGYYMVSADDAGIGGAVGQGNENMPSYVTIYLQVDGIDDHLARIEQRGGKTMVPRTVLPGMVTFALFSDPAGNMLGLVESQTPPAE